MICVGLRDQEVILLVEREVAQIIVGFSKAMLMCVILA